ncbi:MAG: Fe-S oxidoreductase subunit, GlpC family [Candidatus Methanohalarchaeum thermophilum]|uniref:Fe-S oxidoreductase subunit, GlpC family n=1 Tax=Methanohalarchaeum thermophilum TaxID=1903181 RepID=A0A1Q6DVU5_METT1|nr:MAG: Fe-S oxidoreductase subunit, GlpC family [Candidatus Methanohalarchaeum thermophilum]
MSKNKDSNSNGKNEKDLDVFRALQPKQLAELDACTRCGECEEWCPTADATDDMEVAPRSKILRWRDYVNRKHSLKSKIFGEKEITEEELEEFKKDLYTCTTCGTCEEVCPVDIHTVPLWMSMRQNLVLQDVGPYERQDAFLKLIDKLRNPYQEDPEERVNWIPDDVEIQDEAEYGYYIGCTASLRQRKVALASMRILNYLDVPFTILGDEEECCGSVLWVTGQVRSGSKEERIVEELARNNVKKFEEKGVKKVLHSCAGCYRTAKVFWPRVVDREIGFENYHIAELLADKIRNDEIEWKKELDYELTYHDPCHLRGEFLEVFEDPRYVLENIPGIHFTEMDRNREMARCCGAGGGVKAGLPDVALGSATNRCEDALDKDAEILSSACPFCKTNMSDARDELVNQGELDEDELMVEDLVILVAEALDLDIELEEE